MLFWLAVGGFLIAGYMLYAVSEDIGFHGTPTPTKAGAEDDKEKGKDKGKTEAKGEKKEEKKGGNREEKKKKQEKK